MEIRKLSIDDIGKYLKLLSQLNGYECNVKNIEQKYDVVINSDCIILVLVIDNEIVSTGRLQIIRKFNDNVGYIEDVVTDIQHRKKGYGKIIVDKLILESKKNHCYKCVLCTKEETEYFYITCGMKKSGIVCTKFL